MAALMRINAILTILVAALLSFLMRSRPIHLHAGDQYNNALQRPLYGYRKALGEAQLEHPVSAKYKLRFCLQFHGLYLTLTTLTVRPDRRVLVVLRH